MLIRKGNFDLNESERKMRERRRRRRERMEKVKKSKIKIHFSKREKLTPRSSAEGSRSGKKKKRKGERGGEKTRRAGKSARWQTKSRIRKPSRNNNRNPVSKGETVNSVIILSHYVCNYVLRLFRGGKKNFFFLRSARGREAKE